MMATEYDGLEGVSDDELEAAADRLVGRTDHSRSATPPGADPQGEVQAEADPQDPVWKQLGYDTPETTVESVRLLRNDRSRQETEKNEWKTRFEALEARMNANPMDRMSPRDNIAARGEVTDELSLLENDYHVGENGMLRKAVEKLTDERVAAFLKPLVEMTQADSKMAEMYGPEYAKRKPQIDAFVASNPRVLQVVTTARERGMPEVAAEYALKAFTEALVFATHDSLQNGAEALEQVNGASRRVAAPMQSREHSRTKLAKAQAGGLDGIDMAEAVARANRGDDRLIDAAFASQLPSEETLLKTLYGSGS